LVVRTFAENLVWDLLQPQNLKFKYWTATCRPMRVILSEVQCPQSSEWLAAVSRHSRVIIFVCTQGQVLISAVVNLCVCWTLWSIPTLQCRCPELLSFYLFSVLATRKYQSSRCGNQ